MILFNLCYFLFADRVFTTVVTALGNNFSPSRCPEISPNFVKDVRICIDYSHCIIHIMHMHAGAHKCIDMVHTVIIIGPS